MILIKNSQKIKDLKITKNNKKIEKRFLKINVFL